MMKRFILTLTMFCFVALGYSQYYYIPYLNAGTNPGGLNTMEELPVGQGLDPTWTVIHEGGKAIPEWTPIINMPFLFEFNGEAAFQFKVSTAGILTFDTNSTLNPSYQNSTLPSADIPNKSISLWGLSGASGDDKIVMRSFEGGDNKQLWISFNNYGYVNGLPICNHYWSIVLEENTNNIYIVDQKGSVISTCQPELTLGIQIDAQNAIQVDGSPAISGNASTDPSANDNSFYEFIQGAQPKQDVRAIDIDVPGAVLLSDAPVVIKGNFLSVGADELKSFDLNYTIDNGPVQTHHFSGVFSDLQLEHNIPWIPTALGSYEVKLWVSNPNGQDDAKPADNELIANISVVERVPPRLALIESFTQHNCGPCASQNPSLTAVTHANPHLHSTLKWVVTWPGANNDPRHHFNSPANTARRNYYSVSGVPRTIVSGSVFQGQPGQVNVGMLQAENAKPNMVNFDISQTISGTNFDISVDATVIKDPGVPNLTLQVAVVQDELHYASPTGSNGEKDFYDIMRYVLPDINGTVLTPGVGNITTVSELKAIDPIFYESFVHVTAWVQDDATQDVFAVGKNIGIYLCADGTAITPTPNVTEASCAGNDGGISLNIQGGTAPYNFNWSSGETTQIISAKSAGDYEVTVTDANGCSFVLPVQIPEKPAPNVITSGYTTSCNGDVDGEIKTYVAGGATPYTFAWSNGATTKDISGLAPGLYTLSMTDADGCVTGKTVTITEPATVAATGAMDMPDNGTNNGQGTVEVTGGTHPYTIEWNTNPMQTGATATELASGTYDVTITDYNGCTTSTSVTIESNVGIEDLLSAGVSKLNVYPNPSKGRFTVDVELSKMDDVSVSIYDVNGRIAHQFVKSSVSMFQEQVNLENVSAGIYTLKIRTSQGVGYQRIVLD